MPVTPVSLDLICSPTFVPRLQYTHSRNNLFTLLMTQTRQSRSFIAGFNVAVVTVLQFHLAQLMHSHRLVYQPFTDELGLAGCPSNDGKIFV